MIFGQKKHHLILVVSFRKYVRSRHALLKALTRPFLGVVLTPKYWAIRRIASFVLKEVIYVYLLTSFRKYWAILDLNQGPKDYESSALTAELMARIDVFKININGRFLQDGK